MTRKKVLARGFAIRQQCFALSVHLYTRSWNDAVMLPFFFRHYDPIVDRYIVHDDESSDDSVALLRSHARVELRRLPAYSDPNSRVISARTFLDDCWKESRGHADWVIVVDIDEHLYHPDLKQHLNRCRRQGVTLIPALGYQMVGDAFPSTDRRLCDVLTMGAPWYLLSKPSIFSPDAITETHFDVGRHAADPVGDVRLPHRDEVLLLHYKYVDFEYLSARHARALQRQRSTDVEMNWGVQYSWSREELLESWTWFSNQLVDISRKDLRPWATHLGKRWWQHHRRVQRWPFEQELRYRVWQRRRANAQPDEHPAHLLFKQ